MRRWAWMLLLVLLVSGCHQVQLSSSVYYERDRHDDKEGVKVEVKKQF